MQLRPSFSPRDLAYTQSSHQELIATVLTEESETKRQALIAIFQLAMPGFKESLPDAKAITDFASKNKSPEASINNKAGLGFVLAVKLGHLPLIEYLIKNLDVFKNKTVFSIFPDVCENEYERRALVEGLNAALAANRFDIVFRLLKCLNEDFPRFNNRRKDLGERGVMIYHLHQFQIMAIEKSHTALENVQKVFLELFKLQKAALSACLNHNGRTLIHDAIEKGSLDFIRFYMAEICKDKEEAIKQFTVMAPKRGKDLRFDYECGEEMVNPYRVILNRMLKEMSLRSDVTQVLGVINELIQLFEDFIPELKELKAKLDKTESKMDAIKKLIEQCRPEEPKVLTFPDGQQIRLVQETTLADLLGPRRTELKDDKSTSSDVKDSLTTTSTVANGTNPVPAIVVGQSLTQGLGLGAPNAQQPLPVTSSSTNQQTPETISAPPEQRP